MDVFLKLHDFIHHHHHHHLWHHHHHHHHRFDDHHLFRANHIHESFLDFFAHDGGDQGGQLRCL